MDENENFYADSDITLDDDFVDEEIETDNNDANDELDTETENDDTNESDDTETNTENDDDTTEQETTTKKPPMSKETKALIASKKANKELRDRLSALEEEKNQQRLENKKKELIRQYVDEEGYDDEKAMKLAEKDIKAEALEARLDKIEYTSQAKELVKKYPDVLDELHRLIPLCKKTGWSLEKICRAELEPANTYDVRTKAEQEVLAKKNKGASKKIDNPTSSGKKEDKTTLTDSQERLYKMYVKSPIGKGKSKKDFLETLNLTF